jgi:probable phosphoglycerate mutase
VFFPDEASRAPFRGRSDADTPLSEVGLTQARALGVQLRAEHGTFDVVFDSGYVRTRDTLTAVLEAWPLNERRSIERHSDDLLRERDAGHAGNMTTVEAEAAFPWLREYWQAEGPLFARPPGGESLMDVAGRVRLFLATRDAVLANRRVLIVSHIGTMRMFRYVLANPSSDPRSPQWQTDVIANCGTLVF